MVFSTSQFEFDKEYNTLLAELTKLGITTGFPKEILVVSSHTNKLVNFVQDDEAYIENEGWDGEQMVYCSPDVKTKVVLIPY